ncbi:MAG: class I SAM-dependent methyltransferase [Proteobacteria bacterium]|nr:class I SAM-dependent methyltransferase [Pseudomonadota bacterium]
MARFTVRTHVLLGALAAAGFALAAWSAPSASITAAVADPARPADDTQRDADRKPAAMLEFAGVRPGETVIDLIAGRGYFTRLFSAAVGPAGKVYAVATVRPADAPADAPDRSAPVKAIAADPHYGNVTAEVVNLREYAHSPPVDLIWTSQNYHDLHNVKGLDVVGLDKALFAALKPGGTFIVLDHSAEAGSGFRDTDTLHRIDEEAVKKEVESAGFKFEGESNVLRNKDDPRTAKVFDPSIRGHTDQFILKFRKPKS